MKIRLIALSLLIATSAQASLFELTGTVAGVTTTKGFDSFEDAYNAMNEAELRTIFAGYNGTQIANISLNFRGLPVTLTYPTANDPTLKFSIPALGINQTFVGATRQASENLWTDYLKNNTDLLGKLQKELVKVSPIDPIAGNPNSLMSRSIQMDYDQMLRSPGTGLAPSTAAGGSSNSFAMGINAGQMSSDATGSIGSSKSTSVTLPLSYSHEFGETNHELYINLPITYTKVEEAKVYDASFSMTYRRPLTQSWVLAGTVGSRVAGSKELASLGVMGSGAIMSSYTFNQEGWQLTVGNMVSYYKTLTMQANGNSYNPDIRNTVYRNGVLFATDSGWLAGSDALSWEFSVVDMRFKGTELFNQYQDEFGITFGSRRPAHSSAADFRGGVTYIKAEHAQGYRLNFGAWF